MDRRSFLKNCALSVGALTFGGCAENLTSESSKGPRPNIVYILADDLGYGDVSLMSSLLCNSISSLATEGPLVL